MEEMLKKIKTPESQAEITTEWLKTVLPEVSRNELVNFESDKNFGPWSLLGKAIRLKLDWSTPECEPKSVIVKFQVSTSEPRMEGEIYNLLSEAKVPYIPHIFSTFGNGNLVMEDLSQTHSVLKNDFNLDQVRNVLSILADFNGKFLNNNCIPKYDISHYINSININMGQCWDIFKKRYKEQIGNTAADFEWMLKNQEIVARHYNSSPATLSHGDVNASNLLFPNDGSNKPIFIDWQLAAQRAIPFDLNYFLVKSLTAEQRWKNEGILLKEYYQLLPDKIRNNYSFDRMVLDYRACVTRSMLSAVMRIGPRYEGQPNRFKAADELATRVIEAVKDLEPVDAIKELEKPGSFKE
jgi:hypothetical protein